MEHPIQGMMDIAMSKIKNMVDVDTIIGDPVVADDGTMIIPISKVTFGFGAGGSEFTPKKASAENSDNLFGGGCGGGASVNPVAFLVINGGNVRLIPMTSGSSPLDKLVDLVPDLIDKVNGAVSSMVEKRQKKEKSTTVESVEIIEEESSTEAE
jgi:sporulation protein YtfJ